MDIDYLKQNSVKESKIIRVNSSERNKLLGPKPNDYVVEFIEPFKYVYGLEILSTSISRSMYIIDIYNSKITFGINYNGTWYNSSVIMEYQDYNIETLISELNTILTIKISVPDYSVSPVDVMSVTLNITAASLSSTPIRKSKIKYTCPYMFRFDMSQSTTAEVLGLDEYTDSNDTTYTALDLELYGCIADSDSTTYITSAYKLADTTDDGGTLYDDSDSTFHYLELYQNHNIVQIFCRESNTTDYSNFSRFLHNFWLYINVASADTSIYNIAINLNIYSWDPDNSVLGTLLYTTSVITSTSNTVKIINSSYASPHNVIYRLIVINLDNDTYNSLCLASSTPYAFIFSCDDVTIDNPILVYTTTKDTTNYTKESTYTMTVDTNNTYTIDLIPDNESSSSVQRSIALEVYVSYKTFVLTPTGILNLVGERFIILRCPEIESQLSSSYSFGNNAVGIGLFTLGVLGYADSRFDFTSIVQPEFHPIGKLSRLSLRFETAGGNLYDFKGVNHHIVMVVKYFRPRPVLQSYSSTLNPNYNPNIIEYLRTQEDKANIAAEQYNKDDEDFLSKNFRQIYLEKEKQYIEDDSDADVDINDVSDRFHYQLSDSEEEF